MKLDPLGPMTDLAYRKLPFTLTPEAMAARNEKIQSKLKAWRHNKKLGIDDWEERFAKLVDPEYYTRPIEYSMMGSSLCGHEYGKAPRSKKRKNGAL